MRSGISGQPTLKTIAKSVALAAVLVAAPLFAEPAPPSLGPPRPTYSGPHDAGLMAEPSEREASGLAASQRSDDVYWVLNDSGNDPILHAIDSTGARRGRIRVQGVRNHDWEDLASFTLDGQPYLLVADTGDNFSNRPRVFLHLVPEPTADELSADRELVVAPTYTIPAIFEDGARDCESVAVDSATSTIWLLSKRDSTPRLYRLPLSRPDHTGLAVARRTVDVQGIAPPDELRRRILARFSVHWPTALDFSPDGRSALVLTLDTILIYPRAENESWPEAFSRPPIALPPHKLPQSEAACFTRDGKSILVCSEKTMRWLRYDRQPD